MKRHTKAVRPCVGKFTGDEEKQDKRQTLPHRQLAHFCPQCGQFAEDGDEVTNRVENDY